MKAYSRSNPRPALKRFKLEPKFPHHRSEGLTHRRNRGSMLQPNQRDMGIPGHNYAEQ